MAEQESQNAIVKADSNEYQLKIKEFSASGQSDTFAINVPQTGQWGEALIRAGFLKKGVMKDQDFGSIMCAILYADSFGLNALAGDVYIVGGRLATTADAKIRHALRSGLVEGYEVEIVEGVQVRIPWKTSKESGVYEGPELTATVTVEVKGWKRPVVYEASLSEWFEGSNPNWRSRPKFMLRKNALSKALAEVAPLGVEADEAPPLQFPAQPDLTTLLQKSIDQVQEKKKLPSKADPAWVSQEPGMESEVIL